MLLSNKLVFIKPLILEALYHNMFYCIISAYVLRCGLSRFYRLWYRYYERYQCISKIFTKMYSKRLFISVNYVAFFKTHHGFKLRGKLFIYNGKSMFLLIFYTFRKGMGLISHFSIGWNIFFVKYNKILQFSWVFLNKSV